MNQIVSSINVFLKILPVQKSSDFASLIIHGFTLSAYFHMPILTWNHTLSLSWKI